MRTKVEIIYCGSGVLSQNTVTMATRQIARNEIVAALLTTLFDAPPCQHLKFFFVFSVFRDFKIDLQFLLLLGFCRDPLTARNLLVGPCPLDKVVALG